MEVVRVIRVHLMPHLFGVEKRVTMTIAGPATARDLIATRRHPAWRDGAEIAASVYGRRIADLDEPLDGVDVVLCPVAGATVGFAAFAFWAVTILGLVVSARMLLDPPGGGVGDEQPRGDESSPVYSWDRIHTEYRQGFPLPSIYGEVDTGGQVIYSDVQQGINRTELLNVVLALSEGRIESIGEVVGGTLGEIDGMGGFLNDGQFAGPAIPQDLRVNGNRMDHTIAKPGVKVWTRCGEPRQSALPAPFLGTRSILAVSGGTLQDAGETVVTTITPTAEITNAVLVFAFPAGVYQQSASGVFSNYVVNVDVYWRPVGQSSWNFVNQYNLGGTGLLIPRTYWVTSRSIPFPNSTGQIEVRVTRISPQGGQDVVSTLDWRQISYGAALPYRYPGTALIGLSVAATEQTVSGRSEFVVRVRGRRVRVFDSTLGLSSSNVNRTQDGRYWLVPPSGDPFFGIWSYPPGQNPAWILADFLTDNTRGGVGLDDADIDWLAIRDWADFCDQSVAVGAGMEALCKFDAVLDSPRPAWDTIMEICRAGRAVPVRRGRTFSVIYSYSDAHGRGSNSVPARTVTQLFHAGNLNNFEVTYTNRMTRPAVFVAQFTNADKDHQQDTIDVEDPEGGFNRPDTYTPIDFIKEAIQLYGITRPSQVRRDLLFRHALNREIGSECSFSCAIEALAADVGDLIDVQDDSLRPYGTVESFAARVYESGTAVTSIKLTLAVTIAGATTYQVRLRDRGETIVSRTITTGVGTYPAGTALTFSGAAINIDEGAPVVFGVLDQLVKTYQIIEIGLNEDLTRQARAIEWVPEVHDSVDVGDSLPESEEPAAYQSPTQLLVTDTGATATTEHVTEIVAERLPDGTHTIGWVRPTHRGASAARLYALDTTSGAWERVAEVAGSQAAAVLVPGQTYTMAVTLADPIGLFQSPEEVPSVTVVGAEFPIAHVPELTNGSLVVTGDNAALAIEWEPVTGRDVDEYEVRRGTDLLVAPVVACVDTAAVVLDGPVGLPDAAEGVTAETVMVRARGAGGLLSARPLILTATPGATSRVAVHDVAPDPAAGTLADLSSSGGAPYELTIADDRHLGTWTSGSYALAYNAEAIISFGWVATAESGETVDDLTFAVDSGEALWRLVNGRPSSPAQPGGLIDELVDDFGTTLVDDIEDARLVGAWSGEPGDAFAVRVWFRTAKTGETITAMAWRQYLGPVVVLHDIIQWRVELFRNSAADTITVRGFRLRRFL